MIETLLAGLFLTSALGLIGGSIYLFWKVRTAGRPRSPASDGGLAVTLFPAFALVVLVVGAVGLLLPKLPEPQPPLVVKLTGYQFGWKFEYFESSGAGESPQTPLRSLSVSTTDYLVLPRGVDILVLATSTDVIHRLEIPRLQVRKDLIPGLISKVSLNAPEAGEFIILSDGLCGAALNLMVAKLTVVEPAAFQEWVEAQARVAAVSGHR